MIKLKSCNYFFCVFQCTRFAEHPPAIARATQFACLSRRWHHQRGGRCLRHMSWRGFWGRGRSAVLRWMQFVRTSLLLWTRGLASRLLVLHAVWICIRWEIVLYFYISFVFGKLYSKFNPVKRRKRKLHFLQVPKRIWNWSNEFVLQFLVKFTIEFLNFSFEKWSVFQVWIPPVPCVQQQAGRWSPRATNGCTLPVRCGCRSADSGMSRRGTESLIWTRFLMRSGSLSNPF